MVKQPLQPSWSVHEAQRYVEHAVHWISAEIINDWDYPGLGLAATSFLLSALLLSASLLFLALVAARAFARSRRKSGVLAVSLPLLALAARSLVLLGRFTASRCDTLDLGLVLPNATYPAAWPWADGLPGQLDQLSEVPRIHGTSDTPSWAEVRRLGLPVVVEASLGKAHNQSEWIPVEVAARLRHRPAEGAPRDFFLQLGHPEQQAVAEIACPLVDFLERLGDDSWLRGFGDRQPYLAEETIDALQNEAVAQDVARQLLPAGSGDISQPLWKGRPVSVELLWWIGPGGAQSGLHADPYPLNVLFVLHGSKTVWVYPPSEEAKLYVRRGIYDYGASISAVSPFSPDLESFPEFQHARPLRARLRAGDALFIPAGWFHYARSDTTSVSITGRVFTTCEIISFWDTLLLGSLKHLGMLGLFGMTATDEQSNLGSDKRNQSNVCKLRS